MAAAFRHLRAVRLDAAAFAPFGDVLAAPISTGATLIAPLAAARNLRPDRAVPRLAWFAVPATAWPVRATVMERHRFSSQSFVPCGPAEWLVLVAPDDAQGGPDMGAARAFVAGGDQAVTIRADIWHHPVTAFAACRFAVLTCLAGDADDEEFRDLARPVEIERA